MSRGLVFLISLVLLTGCATNATGPLFTIAPSAPQNMGTLYVGLSSAILMMPGIIVKINDKPFVSLAGKNYSYVYLPPGIYRLSFVCNLTLIFMTELEILPGRNLYESFNAQYSSVSDLPSSSAPEFLKNFHYVTPINTSFEPR
jgi:hypothetical protein